MQRMYARDAKNGFGRLIDIAMAEPVAIKKHGRAVVVVVAFEEYEGLTGKKILVKIDIALRRARQVGKIQGTDPKQLASALAVTAGNNGRVDPVKAVAVKEIVNGIGQRIAHASDGAEGIGARPQVGLGAQVFEAVTLLGDRVSLRVLDHADHLDGTGLDFHALALALRGH